MSIAHRIRISAENNSPPSFDESLIKKLFEGPPPKITEQAANFIRLLGKSIPELGKFEVIKFLDTAAIIGVSSAHGFRQIYRELKGVGYIESNHSNEIQLSSNWPAVGCTLTFKGWHHLEQLKQGKHSHGKAFMAMKFNVPNLDMMLKLHFKPAALKAGFLLETLADRPQMGLIDNRMRVEIQASDFLIADLSHSNNGAYWEAGYAEGLAKPVLYTCEKKKSRTVKRHFDVNHHLTIFWEEDKPEAARQQITESIRLTLPHLAKMTDDDNPDSE